MMMQNQIGELNVQEMRSGAAAPISPQLRSVSRDKPHKMGALSFDIQTCSRDRTGAPPGSHLLPGQALLNLLTSGSTR